MNQQDKDNKIINEAKKKIEKVMMTFYISDPVMLGAMCMIDKNPNPKQETIGINLYTKIPTLEYNPYWVNSITEEVLETIMASEGFKILLRHCTTRLKEPKQISALSSSITINQLLKNDFNRILNGMTDVRLPSPDEFKLKSDLFFEEYYRQLMDREDEINQTISQMWNSMSDQEKKEFIQQAIQNYQNKNQGENDQQNQEKGYKKFKNEEEALNEYFNPNGTSNNGWGENNIFDADIESFITNNMSSIEGWGKYTGNAMSNIIAANTPKISYKEIIRRFYKSALSGMTTFSRMKVHRRYDLELPGYHRKYYSKILFAIDVSGSMSDEDISEGFAVVNKCCKHSQLTYLTFDTKIKDIEKDLKKAKNSFKISGRGGTDPRCIFEFANKNKYDGVIIFSDMYFDSNIKQPAKLKILWLSHCKGQKVPVDFGYRAELNRYENY